MIMTGQPTPPQNVSYPQKQPGSLMIRAYQPLLGGGLKYFLFSSLFGEMIQFDEHIFWGKFFPWVASVSQDWPMYQKEHVAYVGIEKLALGVKRKFDEHIFQMGWNHQLDWFPLIRPAIKPLFLRGVG